MESTTRLITIPDYSKLLAAGSREPTTLDTFHFRGHVWSVLFGTVTYITVGVLIGEVTRRQWSRSASDTNIYIEILDESGEHTVFDEEQTLGNDTVNVLLVHRSELEASSCIRNDSVTVRCTLSLHTRSFFKPTMIFEEPKVVLAGSHTLTIDNFSKHKAALNLLRCARSTRFSVGGTTWYFKLYPNGYFNSSEDYSMSPSLLLTRVSSDEPATTVEFNFELLAGDDGGKYHESTKVTRTFNRASPEHAQLVPITSTPKHDRIIVRCRLAVIKAEMPMPRSEPVLTPLSSDEPATTAEFDFELLAGDDGDKYHEATKVTRTFDRASPEHGQPVPSTSTPKHDSFTVRCRARRRPTRRLSNYLKNLTSFFKEPKVILPMPRSESLLTPLLGCHDVRSA